MTPDNPFAQPSALAYQLPPFDRIRDSDYRPAFLAGMQQQRREIDAIAHASAAPTFENTLVELERSGQLLDRVSNTFWALDSANSSDEILSIETEVAPLLTAHEDAIYLDRDLFARVDTLYQQREQLGLDQQGLQLLARYHALFVRAGAQLSDSEQQRLRDINQQLSSLTTQFRQNVLRATKQDAVVIDQVDELRGLSVEQIGAAASAASQRGLQGKWLIALQNTTTQPVLDQLQDRALRQRIYRASINRCNGGANDNTSIIARIIGLRAGKAALLGYANFATYALEEETANTPQAADAMLREVGAAALRRARREAADIQQSIDADVAANGLQPFTLEPWDWQYYAEQVRQRQYQFDAAHVSRYFELDRVLRDGVFYVAQQLFGLAFSERHDLPVYHADVRVFEVFDTDGQSLGLFLADYYARDNKQGGAWMNNLVEQSQLLGLKPVITNNANIPKPAPGQPTLLTFDEVTTLFHEFGHALHGLLSDVRYPTISGTNVPPDFVEYPSQFNEMWARQTDVVAHFARDYQTGEPMPAPLLAQVIAAQRFDQGYMTSEYIQAALIDLAWHELTPERLPAADQIDGFEREGLERVPERFEAVPPRYHSPYFLHIFSGDQYAAGYYAYLWSEVLARDTGTWVLAHGGLTRANGTVLREKILSRGRTREPSELFREFYGGPPDAAPLLEYRGLTAAH